MLEIRKAKAIIRSIKCKIKTKVFILKIDQLVRAFFTVKMKMEKSKLEQYKAL